MRLNLTVVDGRSGRALDTLVDLDPTQPVRDLVGPLASVLGDEIHSSFTRRVPLWVDGHEVLVVKERIGEAVARARAGGGPTLIEIMTYRFRGHSMSDPGKYRTKEELEERKKNDPVLLARKRLLDGGVKEKEIEAVDAEVEAEVADAVDFAEKAEARRPVDIAVGRREGDGMAREAGLRIGFR